MTSRIPLYGILLALGLFVLLPKTNAAENLFAPEPQPETLEQSGTRALQAPLLAEAGSQATSVAAQPSQMPSPTATDLFRAPDSSAQSNPVSGTNVTTKEPSHTPDSGSETIQTPKAETNSPTKAETASPKGTKSSATAAESSMPVDAPPNLEDSPDKMAASAVAPPSENVTLNLINRLVQRGILTKEDAGDLIRQAKEDAVRAQQMIQATQQATQQAAAAQQMAVDASASPQSDDAVSVSYVPEIVKTEMRDEIKRDVLAAAQSEGWATPNYPSWLANFRPFMDFRMRFEGDYLPAGNDTNILSTINFNAINTSQPYNVSQLSGQSPYQNPPTYNTTEQRDRLRLRFRFGADMNLGEGFTSGFRIGTGQNGSPVSENQTMGLPASGTPSQGGNFSNYAIWLDRAFLKYELGDNPDKMAAITFGRFDNPFYTPTTIMWANDIGFDGVVLQGKYKVLKGFTPFLTGGLFPIYNTDLNFSSTQQPKMASYDKYLYAGQAGFDWKIVKDLNFKAGLGYYYFQNVQGQVSAPQVAYGPNDTFSTDNSRPSFAQKGNTYMEIRDILASPDNNYGTQNQYQYFGLATPFNILSANGRLEYRRWEPFVLSVSGEWDQNTAWSSSNIQNSGPSDSQNPYNVHGPINNTGSNNQYQGGNNAWIGQFKIGSGALQKRWDWDFGLSYRYVESDALIDGFCDSDFGGGGTNLKGWAVGGNIALSKNVFLSGRWFNADSIAGPTIKSNILQLDVNARF